MHIQKLKNLGNAYIGYDIESEAIKYFQFQSSKILCHNLYLKLMKHF